MSSTPPIITYEVVADYPAALGDRIRSTGSENDNAPNNYQRVWSYGGRLYNLIFDYNGNDTDGADPYYLKRCWSMQKSTDGGATWARQDFSNRPMGGNYGTSAYGEAAVQIGAKIWVFFDYGEHEEVSPSVYGYQFDEIRAMAFDCATDTWGAVATSGPIRALTDTAYDGINNLAVDCCYRGSNEIVVLHSETDYTQTPLRSMYSVFNTATESWSAVSVVAFESLTAADVVPSRCWFDGTVTNLLAESGIYSSSTAERWHRTLSGSTLGAETNLFASWPGAWRALTADYQNYQGFAATFGTENIFVQPCLLNVPSGPGTRYTLVAFRATAGATTPTWTIEEMDSTAWDALYADWGNSGTPFLVENRGDLYCVANGWGYITFAPLDPRLEVYAQRYAGAGAWDAPASLWSHFEAFGDGYEGVYQQNDIFKASGVGGLSGTSLARQIGFVGTLSWAPELKDTVRFWRGDENTCCCSDYSILV